MEQNLSKKTRTESDLIGSREVPESALYGVQTLRGIENFRISKFHLNEYPLFIQALAITKMGAAVANRELDLLTEEQTDAILRACKEILEGKHDELPESAFLLVGTIDEAVEKTAYKDNEHIDKMKKLINYSGKK